MEKEAFGRKTGWQDKFMGSMARSMMSRKQKAKPTATFSKLAGGR